jgi:hypothetical protein
MVRGYQRTRRRTCETDGGSEEQLPFAAEVLREEEKDEVRLAREARESDKTRIEG